MCRRLKQIMGALLVDPVSPICLVILSMLQKNPEREIFSPLSKCASEIISFSCLPLLSSRPKSELSGKKSSFVINFSVGGKGPSLDLILVSEPRRRFSFLLDRFVPNCFTLATCIIPHSKHLLHLHRQQ